MKEQEVHHPTEGLLAALHDVAKEVRCTTGLWEFGPSLGGAL